MVPTTHNPVVIRTAFDNQEGWETICGLIRAPVCEGTNTFYAYVDFVDDERYRNMSLEQLLAALPPDTSWQSQGKS